MALCGMAIPCGEGISPPLQNTIECLAARMTLRRRRHADAFHEDCLGAVQYLRCPVPCLFCDGPLLGLGQGRWQNVLSGGV